MAETTTVRPGQVWADNDPRSAGRTLRVDTVDDTHATCTVLTNADGQQWLLDNPNIRSGAQDTRGRKVRIRLDRFRPTSTGYRLIGDMAEEDR